MLQYDGEPVSHPNLRRAKRIKKDLTGINKEEGRDIAAVGSL